MVSETTPMVLAEGHVQTMALDQSALLEVLEVLKAAEVDERIRQAAETIYQALIEAELSGGVPASRTEARTGLRHGHRPRTVTTAAGDLELKIPRMPARHTSRKPESRDQGTTRHAGHLHHGRWPKPPHLAIDSSCRF